MAYTEQGGTWGDWGPDAWTDGDATVQPNGPQVQSNSVLTQSTEAAGSGSWTGYFQTLLTRGLDYAAARDAAKAGLTPARSANGTPVYVSAAPQAGGLSQGGVIVIAAAILGGLILASHKG